MEMEFGESAAAVTVYWRPGCPYCYSLRRALRRSGLAVTEINIWESPDASARVRSYANGNETVPTVVIGNVALVNPSARQVLEATHNLVHTGVDPDTELGGLNASTVLPAIQWLVIGAMIVFSFVSDAMGHSTVSWATDGVALLLYLGFRIARRQTRGERGVYSR